MMLATQTTKKRAWAVWAAWAAWMMRKIMVEVPLAEAS
jgi:hypothetical protein